MMRKLYVTVCQFNKKKCLETQTDYLPDILAGFKVLAELRMADERFSKEIGEAINHL